MSLVPPPGPENGRRALLDAVPALNRIAEQSARGPYASQLTVAARHRTWRVGLQALARGARWTELAHTGWGYLVYDGERPIAAARLSRQRARRVAGPATAEVGPFVGGMVRAIRFAEALDRTRLRRYALEVVQVPELRLAALWLRNRDARRDLVIPIAPRPRWLAAPHYSPKQFWREAQRAAREALVRPPLR
jgi:hypothetical protein